MIELNEIKKQLYKVNPKAYFINVMKGVAYYSTRISDHSPTIYFAIPVGDMGDASFSYEEPAKLLIRWIVLNEKTYGHERG